MDFKEWFGYSDAIDENTSLKDWLLSEVTSTRYSIEVNYRSTAKEALAAFAKIVLGYVGAAMKQSGYHIKQVYEETPIRIVVSSRNWDDGEWAGVVTFHPEDETFIISKGFYNKERRTTSIQSSKKCSGDSAAEITKELRNLMHHVKDQPDKHAEKLKGVPMKRGPKR
jgi:hypothetical protein